MSKTIKFYTLGCKANQYDTQAIREQFQRAGFCELDNGEKADICLINTCTVTHRADSDSLNFIRRAKRENPKAKIIVTGCLAETDAERIRKIKGINLMLKHSLLRDPALGISDFKNRTRAFLKIQDGCNNFCSYCKVPLARGESRSRPLPEIVQEAQRLAEKGFKEIVLTGICLGLYGKDMAPKSHLVAVLQSLEKIAGLCRIRLSSIEAGDVSDALIAKMAQSKKICRHLHIPIQSGDDEILKKMHRKYTRDDYQKLIKKIKRAIPEIAITTDCIVGFPGEKEDSFKNTLALIKEILPLKVHVFPYSKRAGTPAANFKDEVPAAVTKERGLRLNRLAQRLSVNYRRRFLNRKMDALIEGRAKNNPLIWGGYTDNYLKVWFKSKEDLSNKIIACRVGYPA